MCDEVLILDALMPWCAQCGEFRIKDMGCSGEHAWDVEPTPYLDESTSRELAYAEAHGKRVRFLSKEEKA